MTKGRKSVSEEKKPVKKEGAKHREKHPAAPEKRETRTEIKKIIRLGETNIDGSKRVEVAIRQIKGVSFAYAHAIAKTFGYEDKMIGDLSEDELKNLENMITAPEKHNIPSWLFNRRMDPDSGTDKHIVTSNLELTQKMDKERMKKVKSYKGIRHMFGLPVRGQRTRGSFRKGKSVGVSRKAKAKQAAKSGK